MSTSQLKLQFAPGEVIFREGDPGRELYILLEGKAAIHRNGALLAEVDQPKSFLGEVGLLLDQPRGATVTAVTACTVFRVPDSHLPDFWQRRPELALQLARALARRLEEMNLRCAALLQSNGETPPAEEPPELADEEPEVARPTSEEQDDDEDERPQPELEDVRQPRRAKTLEEAPVPQGFRELVERRLDLRLQVEGLTQYRRGLQPSVEQDAACMTAIRQQESLLRRPPGKAQLEQRAAKFEAELAQADGVLRELLDIGLQQVRMMIQQDELVPRLVDCGARMTAEEPLAITLGRMGIPCESLFGLAAYQLLVEEEQARAEAESQQALDELGGEEEEDEQAAHAVAAFALARRDLLQRESDEIERRLVEEYWIAYKMTVIELIGGKVGTEEEPCVRAFLRWGLLGSGPRWIEPELAQRILARCRQPRRECRAGMGDTYVLYADEYIEWVVKGHVTPAFNEDLELNHRDSARWRADRARRRLIHNRWMEACYRELAAHSDRLLESQNQQQQFAEQALAKIRGDREQKKPLREQIQECKVEIGRLTRLLDRINNEWLAEILAQRQSWNEKLTKTGEAPEPLQLAGQEVDFIRRVCRLVAKLQEPFQPRMLRQSFRPDQGRVLERDLVTGALRDAEQRDPRLLQDLLVDNPKKVRRVYLRHSPVVLIVPAFGVMGYAADPRKGTEFGRLILPGMVARAKELQEILWDLLADFRFETSKGEAGLDTLNADTLAAAYAQIRWSFRRRPADLRQKALINMEEKEPVNWRRHYRLYMKSAMEGGKRLFFKCPELYEMLLKYIDLPDGVERLRK